MFKKIFFSSLLFFSIILTAYTIYRSEFYWNGELRSYYLKYYYTSAFLLSFSIFSFFLSEKIKLYIMIILISILGTLYLFEGFTFVKNSPNFIKDKKKFSQHNTETLLKKFNIAEKECDTLVKKKHVLPIYKECEKSSLLYNILKARGVIDITQNYDARPITEAYKYFLKSNPKLTIPVFPFYFKDKKNLDYFPLSGRSYADLIYCNENGYYNKFTTDRYGFNNPDQVWDTASVEYLIIGDSFAYGNCVNRPDDISSVLRKLSQDNIINLGQSGSGPLIEFAILKEFFPINVKKVIWLFYEGNDLGDLKIELKNDILNKYFVQQDFSQELKKNQNIIDSIVKKTRLKNNDINVKKNIFNKIKDFIKLTHTRNSFSPTLKPMPNNNFKQIIKKAKDLSNSRGAEFFFVYLPEFARFQKNYRDDHYEAVKKVIIDLDIQFIDINNSVFKKLNNPKDLFPIFGKGHYNEAGYYKTAESIFKNIN
tara:strand:- start:2879 stop:4321 length:1443 start_codon:yes stop_codon:yes gene_type:complete